MAQSTQPTQTIRGYELRELLGEGGFGAVYRAHQTLVNREVAIKIILPQYANHPDFIRRFEAEAHLIARLEHPFIVPLYDYWREPDSAYLVMRWLRGGSLRSMLVRQGPISIDIVERCYNQIASALTVAHRNGIVHRDLKPDNILFDEEGNAYLTDFGIAKDLELSVTTTRPESFLGSYAYVSPEQAMGEQVTQLADQYSLGIVLYELLAGEHPFPNTAPGAMLMRHINDKVPSLSLKRPDLPLSIDAVIQRATSKSPGARYADVLALNAAFRKALKSRRPSKTGIPVLEDETHEVTVRTTADMKVATPITSTPVGILVVEPQNPYRGLRAFSEADAHVFFGRESLTAQILERLAENEEGARFLAVVGPSGSGKSSAVKAGAIPLLRKGALPDSEHWFTVDMFPSAYPLEELEAALLSIAVHPPDSLLGQLREDERGLMRAVKRVMPRSEDAELLLVIDQFEELFTLVQDEAVRTQFLESLYVAVNEPHSQLRVIITLRTDFYGHVLTYPNFGALVRKRTEVVLPMTPDELRRAIVGPAEQVGLFFEEGLAETILETVRSQPGALPLLQFALTELFERREGRNLTMAAYYSSGGVLGALARRAEELYVGLDTDGQEAVRQLFLRLVTLGEGMEDTRRRVLLTELKSIRTRDSGEIQNAAIDSVIDAYGKYRLLTFDRDPTTREPIVDIAHEALIREWARLREWLSASREDVRLQRRVASAAGEWLKSDRDPSFLASGARLDQFEGWLTTTDLAHSAEELEYLQASIAERERQQAYEKARLEHEALLEHRSQFRLRVLVAVLAIATLLAFGLTALAFGQRQIAQDNAATATMALGRAQLEANNAETQVAVAATAMTDAQNQQAAAERNAAEAQSLALAASAQRALNDGDTELAVALALEANKIDQPPAQAQSILYESVYAPGVRQRLGSHSAAVRCVAISPDGKLGISGSDDQSLIVWDLTTGKQVRRLLGHTSSIWAVAFSPTGATIVSGAGRPRLVDAVPIAGDNTLRLWNVETGQELLRFQGHTDAVTGVAFSPDGQTIVSSSADKSLILWDALSGKILQRFEGHTDAVLSVAFSPDGKTILSASADHTLILWDVATGQPIRTLQGHGAQVNSVAFSPDGRTAISGAGNSFSKAEDFVVILWDVASGAEIRRFRGHTGAVTSVAFSLAGDYVLSASADKSLILWDAQSGNALRHFEGHADSVLGVALDRTRDAALSGSADKGLILWDLASGAEISRMLGHTGSLSATTFRPDGQLALSASLDNSLILWDLRTRTPVRRLAGHTRGVLCVTFSPDGKTALSGSEDNSLILWDVQTGQEIRRFRGHIARVTSAAFTPDGKYAVSGSGDRVLILWDVQTGAEVRRFSGHNGEVTGLAMSRDGKTVLSSSVDKSLILWDINTGALLRSYGGHTSPVRAVALSPDGRLAASGSDDGTLILWYVQIGAAARTIALDGARITTVAFSPDGKAVLVGLADSSLILLDVQTGNVIQRFNGHTGAVASAVFSPDGKFALSGGSDERLILWQVLTPAELIAWAQGNHFIRQLTCAERVLFRTERPC